MTVGMWILTTLITILIGIIAFGGKFAFERLIKQLDKLTESIDGLSDGLVVVGKDIERHEEKIKDVDYRISGTNATVMDMHDRLLTLETEHKNRKCK